MKRKADDQPTLLTPAAEEKAVETQVVDTEPDNWPPSDHLAQPIALPEQPKPAPSNWLGVIDKMLDKNVSAELLTKVFEMQTAWEKEQQRREFVEAFAAFKAEAPAAIERTGKVGYESKRTSTTTSYEHVELDVACNALVPIMSKHGLAHSWEPAQADNGMISITCRLEHCGGHSRTVTLKGMPDASGSKNPIQAVGSATYYLQRYTLLAILGVAQAKADDDGKKAASSGATLNDEQIDMLNKLIADTNTDTTKFLAWVSEVSKAEVKDLKDILQSNFTKVRDMLQAKLKKSKT